METDWQSFLFRLWSSPWCLLSRGGWWQGGQSKTIGAHRLILAGVSPVFRGIFFGPMDETGEVVEVKETTLEAFDTVKLFELLTLVNRWQLIKLTMMTSDALESLAITRENMIFTTTVAKNYKEVFDDLSSKLTLKFLFDTTSGGVPSSRRLLTTFQE